MTDETAKTTNSSSLVTTPTVADVTYEMQIWIDCNGEDGHMLTRAEYVWLKAMLGIERGEITEAQAIEAVRTDPGRVGWQDPILPYARPQAAPQPTTAAAERRGDLKHFLLIEQALSEGSGVDLEMLQVAALILKRHVGCNTPCEEFLCDLIYRYGHSGRITPDNVREDLTTFEENLNDMARDVALFAEQYPELIDSAPEAR